MRWATSIYFSVAGALCIVGSVLCAFADPPWTHGVPAFAVLAAAHFAAAWFVLATWGRD
jgi:hypothetical protein